MKYLFTTLAVGQEYLDNAIECYSNIGSKTNCDFNITTNVDLPNTERINFDYFTLDRYHDTGAGFSFFLDLKCLSLKYALDKGYDYVIFNDADWRITENFTEDKILSLFNYMEKNDLDLLFERPGKIGYYKDKPESCFFQDKLNDFHVYEHNKWDDAHVTNEQFLVFRVNWKFRYFVRRWEEMMWYSIANNIRNYPDGFEIGVAALESEMKYDYDQWRALIRDCFKFNSKDGKEFIRF